MDLREPPITDNEELNIWLNDVYEWLKYPALKSYTIQTGDISGGDYAEFESDGTLVFKGDATVWEDQQVGLGGSKFAGASDPTWTAYKGGRVLAFDKAQDNIIYFTAQLYHSYKIDSDIEFHIHTAHADGGAGDSIWNFTYSWADKNADFPNITGANTQTITVVSPEDADKHQYDDFGAIEANSGAGQYPSSVILCSLQREGTHLDDDYDDDIYLVALDFHIEMDTVGSRTETTK